MVPAALVPAALLAAALVATALVATALVATALVATALVTTALVTTALVAAAVVTAALVATARGLVVAAPFRDRRRSLRCVSPPAVSAGWASSRVPGCAPLVSWAGACWAAVC